jgi:uncharacterized protein
MKRFLSIILLAVFALTTFAATWRVEDVPNVHVADRTRFLTNPDGIISAAVQTRIDSMLSQVRQATTAEVVAVVIDDIDSDTDIDTFATELFEKWGLGKSDIDNGVLIVVAKDARKAVIRPGYGVEGVLPDITCGHILRDVMFPRFKDGDYDGGVEAAVSQICQLLSDPTAAEELKSKLEDADNNSESDDDIFGVYLAISAVIAVLMLVFLIAKLVALRGKDNYDKYNALQKYNIPYIILTGLFLIVPVIAALPLFILLKYWRNSRRVCRNCGAKMKKLDEKHDNDYLTPSQDLEERIGSVDYDVWLCPDCGETDIYPFINKSASLLQCPYCSAYTCRLQVDRILFKPTTMREGRGVKQYICVNCHKTSNVEYTIPKEENIVILPIGGGGGRGGFGGGGSFGGGFGGGSTGGGGASGGW